MRILAAAFFTLLVALTHWRNLQAQTQTTGAVQGSVIDAATGTPVAGAAVTVLHETKGYSQTTLTDAEGIYFVANLESGVYTISGYREGYEAGESSKAEGLAVRITKASVVQPPPIRLRRIGLPPSLSQPTQPLPADTDSPDEQLVNTTNASRGMNFDRRQLLALPLPGFRTFDGLAFLAPGVAPPPLSLGGTVGPGIGAGVGTSGQFAVNGLRSRSNNFTIDGSDNNDEDIGVRRQGFTSLVSQSIESLQEFQITTLLAEPQFGRNLAAQVNAVSRTGTNDYHGTVYGFATDSRFNAKDPFDSSGGPASYPLTSSTGRPVMIEQLDGSQRRQLAPANPVGGENPYTRSQTGFVFGGPLRSRKTFLFTSFEKQDLNSSKESHFAVPTVADRGLFGRGESGLGIGTSFSFPTSELGDAFFSLFPFPNNPAGTYGPHTFTEVLSASAHGIVGSLKLDHHFVAFGKDHVLTGRYNLTDDSTILPVTGEALFSSLEPLVRTHNVSLILNSSVTSRFANQVRFSYGRTHLDFREVRNAFLLPSRMFPNERFLLNAPLIENNSRPASDPLFKIIPVDIESAPLLRVPVIVGGQVVDQLRLGLGSLGQVLVSGYSPIGVDVMNFPQVRANNTFQTANTFIHSRPKHRVSAGVDLRRTQLNSRLERNFRPLAVFSGARNLTKDLFPEAQAELNRRLGIGTQDFYLGRDLVAVGAPTGFFQTHALVPDGTIGLRFWQTDLFASDQWRPSPDLSFTFGLRYELNTVPGEVNNRIESTFSDPQVQQLPALAAIVDGRQRIYESDANNFAPHVAIAWNPFGDGKSSLRAGYGVYYDQILGSVVSQSRSVFPSFVTFDFAGLGPSISVSDDGTSLLLSSGLSFVNPQNLATLGTLNTYQRTLGPVANFAERISQAFSGVAAGAAGVTFVLPTKNLRTPYAQHWSLTAEQELKKDFLLTLAYVGTRGSHLLRFVTPNLGPNAVPLITQVSVSANLPSFAGDVVAPGYGRPSPSLGSYTLIDSDANSSYHGLQWQLNKRFSRGVQFTTAYTWSHSIDEVSDLFALAGARSAPQTSDRGSERSDSNFDVRHRFVTSFIWDLPIWKGHRWLGGWQVAAIGTAQSGQPYSIYSFADMNLDGNFADRVIPLEDGSIVQNVGRNLFRADGAGLIDLAVNKTFTIRGAHRLELRSEFFNLLNRSQYGIPVNEMLFPSFGKPVNTIIPKRVIQFALKYSF